jgi:uncharacterized protein
MLERFLPKEASFFDFFEKHASLIVRASQIFSDAVSHESLHLDNANNPIKALEHEADEVVHQCLDALHKTFITPIDRDHIYLLVSSMDNILDSLNKAYQCLIMYRLQHTTTELQRLAHVVLASSQKVEQVVKRLRNLTQEAQMDALCVDIHRLENEADDILYQALARLFDEETDARMIIKWKEVYEALEKATDSCEDVADAAQSIILESL